MNAPAIKTVSIREAKDRFAALVRAAEQGASIVITRNGKPVAEIGAHRRKGGLDFEALRRWKAEQGLPQIIFGPVPPDFDDPLPEDFLITPGN